MSKNYTTCKRCSAKNVYWTQDWRGKWTLLDEMGTAHYCNEEKLRAVKCKYCNADDLHWAEEINPVTKLRKAILTESYGLPHACDERIAFIAKARQEKKDKYEAEKKRIEAQPDGPCPKCHTPHVPNCSYCRGYGSFTAWSKRRMLENIRSEIWPMIPHANKRDRW